MNMTGRKLSGIPDTTLIDQVPPPPSSGSLTFSSSSNAQLPIPNNTPNGLVTPIAVSLPAGRFINSISVLFNIQHAYTEDLIINLKAPNGAVINLVNLRGLDPLNNNFVNTVISSTASTRLTDGTSPFTGTFLPDAVVPTVAPTGAIATTNNFNSLYTQPNGQWFLGVADVLPVDDGVLTNWSITINYGSAPASSDVVVEPAVVQVKSKGSMSS